MIVDSQVHVWPCDSRDEPWEPSHQPQLPQPFGPDRLLPLMDAAGVNQAVLIPPLLLGFSNRYALACATAHPDRFAVVGRFDPAAEGSIEAVVRWKDQPGMLGIRLVLTTEPGASWLSSGRLEAFWDAAERAGVPVILRVTGLLSLVAVAAGRHPGLRVIIDHAAALSERSDRSFSHLDELVGLAALPNVAVKLSGLPFYSSGPCPFEDLDEVVEPLYQAFGGARLIWGSDLTRLLPGLSYREIVDHVRCGCPFIDSNDHDRVLGRNALDWLGWT